MRSSLRGLLLCIVLTILLRLPSLFEPYWHGDEGISLLLGQAINRGALLYRDIHDNKPPLLYLLYSFGNTIFWGKLLALLWTIGSVSIFYKLAGRLFTFHKSLLSTLLFVIFVSTPLFEGNIVNGEIFFILHSIWGMYLLFSYRKSSSFWPFFLAGISFSIGALFKLPAITDLLAGILYLLFLRDTHGWPKVLNRIVYLFGGFLIPLTIVIVYFWSNGALPNFIASVLSQNIGYSGWENYFLVPYLVGAGVVTAYLYVRKKYFDSAHLLILLWFMGALLGSRLSIRPYTHYLIQVLPPIALLLAWSYKDTKNIILNYGALALFLIIMIVQFPFNFGTINYQLGYYNNFISLVSKTQNISQHHDFFDPHVARTYQTAEFIVKNTDPDERIFVWGDDPLIYALSERLPVGKYTAAYHVKDWDTNFSDTIYHLELYKPRFIFVSNERISVSPFPYLYNLLDESYRFERAFADILIYRRTN